MSKPAGTKSYISMTLVQLAEYYGPNDLISVQRVDVERRVVEKAMSNFSSPPKKAEESAEPEIIVVDFDAENERAA